MVAQQQPQQNQWRPVAASGPDAGAMHPLSGSSSSLPDLKLDGHDLESGLESGDRGKSLLRSNTWGPGGKGLQIAFQVRGWREGEGGSRKG